MAARVWFWLGGREYGDWCPVDTPDPEGTALALQEGGRVAITQPVGVKPGGRPHPCQWDEMEARSGEAAMRAIGKRDHRREGS